MVSVRFMGLIAVTSLALVMCVGPDPQPIAAPVPTGDLEWRVTARPVEAPSAPRSAVLPQDVADLFAQPIVPATTPPIERRLLLEDVSGASTVPTRRLDPALLQRALVLQGLAPLTAGTGADLWFTQTVLEEDLRARGYDVQDMYFGLQIGRRF